MNENGFEVPEGGVVRGVNGDGVLFPGNFLRITGCIQYDYYSTNHLWTLPFSPDWHIDTSSLHRSSFTCHHTSCKWHLNWLRYGRGWKTLPPHKPPQEGGMYWEVEYDTTDNRQIMDTGRKWWSYPTILLRRQDLFAVDTSETKVLMKTFWTRKITQNMDTRSVDLMLFWLTIELETGGCDPCEELLHLPVDIMSVIREVDKLTGVDPCNTLRFQGELSDKQLQQLQTPHGQNITTRAEMVSI